MGLPGCFCPSSVRPTLHLELSTHGTARACFVAFLVRGKRGQKSQRVPFQNPGLKNLLLSVGLSYPSGAAENPGE